MSPVRRGQMIKNSSGKSDHTQRKHAARISFNRRNNHILIPLDKSALTVLLMNMFWSWCWNLWGVLKEQTQKITGVKSGELSTLMALSESIYFIFTNIQI